MKSVKAISDAIEHLVPSALSTRLLIIYGAKLRSGVLWSLYSIFSTVFDIFFLVGRTYIVKCQIC